MVGHIKALAVFHILWGLMFLFIAFLMAGITVVLAGAFLLADDPEPAGIVILAVLMTGFAIGYGFMALPSIVGGIALLMRRRWARVPLFFAAVLAISSFPYGLALLGYTMVVLLDKDVQRELASW